MRLHLRTLCLAGLLVPLPWAAAAADKVPPQATAKAAASAPVAAPSRHASGPSKANRPLAAPGTVKAMSKANQGQGGVQTPGRPPVRVDDAAQAARPNQAKMAAPQQAARP